MKLFTKTINRKNYTVKTSAQVETRKIKMMFLNGVKYTSNNYICLITNVLDFYRKRIGYEIRPISHVNYSYDYYAMRINVPIFFESKKLIYFGFNNYLPYRFYFFNWYKEPLLDRIENKFLILYNDLYLYFEFQFRF
jgi:hypothetical protein